MAAEKKSAAKSASKSSKSTSKSADKATSTSSSKSTSKRERRSSDAPRAESASTSPAQLATKATRQLLELTGKATEGVVGLERGDEGWRVQVEVVEVRRIPNTTDVLALYEIDADNKGNLQGYRRIRRYARGAAGDES